MARPLRERFLFYLKSAHERYGAIIHAYCLLSNHYHLLLETPQGNLSHILHHINGAYTVYFNAKRKRSGHLFQGRFKAILVEKDEYSKELSRYIHLNPLRAGLVKDPKNYPWSSYPSYIGVKKKPTWLSINFILSYFGKRERSAYNNYRKFVEAGMTEEVPDLLKEAVCSTVLGTEDFIQWIRDNFTDRDGDMRDLPALKGLVSRPSLDKIAKETRRVMGGNHPFYKMVSVYVSHRYSGLSLKEIGRYYSMHGSAVSQASRRMEQRLNKDRKLRNIIDHIEKSLFVES